MSEFIDKNWKFLGDISSIQKLLERGKSLLLPNVECLEMDINIQKEQFSYAHVYAIATAAGYSFQLAPRPLDYDGIDAIIAGRDETNLIRYPRLELQVKSTSAEIISPDSVRYPLSIKNYDDLRIEHLQTPRILILVLIPANLQD